MPSPDTANFAYAFETGELSMGRNIYVGISNVSADQPTESSAVFGTRPFPIAETVGRMDKGEGTITFSDLGELARLIADLGPAYREKRFTTTWLQSAKGRPSIKRVCYGCRLLSEPLDHEGGGDALGGEVNFSFMYMTINGKAPHTGLPNH